MYRMPVKWSERLTHMAQFYLASCLRRSVQLTYQRVAEQASSFASSADQLLITITQCTRALLIETVLFIFLFLAIFEKSVHS